MGLALAKKNLGVLLRDAGPVDTQTHVDTAFVDTQHTGEFFGRAFEAFEAFEGCRTFTHVDTRRHT